MFCYVTLRYGVILLPHHYSVSFLKNLNFEKSIYFFCYFNQKKLRICQRILQAVQLYSRFYVLFCTVFRFCSVTIIVELPSRSHHVIIPLTQSNTHRYRFYTSIFHRLKASMSVDDRQCPFMKIYGRLMNFLQRL